MLIFFLVGIKKIHIFAPAKEGDRDVRHPYQAPMRASSRAGYR